jgi:hypothetical protein
MDGMKARSGAGEYALGVLYLIAPSYQVLVAVIGQPFPSSGSTGCGYGN